MCVTLISLNQKKTHEVRKPILVVTLLSTVSTVYCLQFWSLIVRYLLAASRTLRFRGSLVENHCLGPCVIDCGTCSGIITWHYQRKWIQLPNYNVE